MAVHIILVYIIWISCSICVIYRNWLYIWIFHVQQHGDGIICRTAGSSEIYERSLIGGHSGKSLRLYLSTLRVHCDFSPAALIRYCKTFANFFFDFFFFTVFVVVPNALLLRERPLLLVIYIIYVSQQWSWDSKLCKPKSL